MCPVPRTIDNGGYSATTLNVGSTVTFYCDTGYHLSADPELTCLPSGKWDKPLPECDSKHLSVDTEQSNRSMHLFSLYTIIQALLYSKVNSVSQRHYSAVVQTALLHVMSLYSAMQFAMLYRILV